MDLKEFYFQNIKESEYHHRFLNSVKKVNYTYNLFTGEEETQDYQFEIYDVEEAITKFKELCQPDVNFSPENKSTLSQKFGMSSTIKLNFCSAVDIFWKRAMPKLPMIST